MSWSYTKPFYILFPTPERELIEGEDHVEVNGVIFNKPFVEKPVSAEDHNIYIYYPTSAGGGSQRLFRKVGRRVGEWCVAVSLFCCLLSQIPGLAPYLVPPLFLEFLFYYFTVYKLVQ